MKYLESASIILLLATYLVSVKSTNENDEPSLVPAKINDNVDGRSSDAIKSDSSTPQKQIKRGVYYPGSFGGHGGGHGGHGVGYGGYGGYGLYGGGYGGYGAGSFYQSYAPLAVPVPVPVTRHVPIAKPVPVPVAVPVVVHRHVPFPVAVNRPVPVPVAVPVPIHYAPFYGHHEHFPSLGNAGAFYGYGSGFGSGFSHHGGGGYGYHGGHGGHGHQHFYKSHHHH